MIHRPFDHLQAAYGADRPDALGLYALFASVYGSAVGLGALAFRRSGRRLPSRLPLADVLLLGAGTYKASRLLTKDKVTSFLRAPFTRFESQGEGPEVNESPRGQGLRYAVGELLTCPFCANQWVGTALVGLYLFDPSLGRATAGLLSSVTVGDALHYAETAVHRAVE